jgi:ABC-type transport system involved in multi-copper enzyme maturation permease subunit
VRFRAVFAQELAFILRRPLFWFLVILLLLMSWGLSTGDVQIASGDASVGGTKAWLTSEFSVAFILAMLVAIVYSFFLSIAAGLAVIRDEELRIGEVLHTTSLKTGEYVWGKFLAILSAFLLALGLNLLFAILFNHVVPNPEAEEIRGPFHLVSYLRPALIFALPTLVFVAGTAFYLGERWRRPVTVFLFPVAMLLGCGFFLWEWSPTWLDPRINRALMLIDPGGFRWLNETWIKLDRGARFYNTARISVDLPFALSRLVFAGLGLLGVVLARRHFEATLLGERVKPGKARQKDAALLPPPPMRAARPLSALAMRTRPTGLVQGALRVAGTEARSLFSTPGIYLFGALILLQTLGSSLVAVGPFGTYLILTPGLLAVQTLNPLTLLLCLLLMFYTVESLERDRSSGLSALAWSAPIPTAALLGGKVLANALVAWPWPGPLSPAAPPPS